MDEIGVIIPVYRSTESVKQLLLSMEKCFQKTRLYFYLVDDSGRKEIGDYLKKECIISKEKIHTSYIPLMHTYGQQNALLCGIRAAYEHVNYIITMDEDGEHPAEVAEQLYEEIKKGFDIVYAIPGTENRNIIRSIGSQARNCFFTVYAGFRQGEKVSSFRIMTAECAREAAMSESRWFYLSAELLKTKRKVGNITYYPECRRDGQSGYSVVKLMKLYWRLLWYYGIHHGGLRGEVPYRLQGPVLMMLGGSNCQLHGVQEANKRGITTILADYTKKPPAAAYAEVHEMISTFDVPACVKAAGQWKIDGVMTMGSDQPVYTAAVISEELKLPMVHNRVQALSVTNKKKMKELLVAAKIPTNTYCLINENSKASSIDFDSRYYVIKPLDSQGQRGIFKLSSKEEIITHLQKTLSYSRCKEALVEEFYESDEVTVSGFINEGVLTILSVTDRLLYPEETHIGVCIGHRFPSVHMDQYNEIKRISEAIVKAFSLEYGPFYLQLLIGKDGIRVNELAGRIGGAFEDVIIPYLTGFDIIGAVMDGALYGPEHMKKPRVCNIEKMDQCAAVQLLFCREGEIGYITPMDELRSLPFILDVGYNYREGNVIPKMENATARFGHAVIVGRKENIEEYVNLFYQKISVTDTEGKQMLLRLYP